MQWHGSRGQTSLLTPKTVYFTLKWAQIFLVIVLRINSQDFYEILDEARAQQVSKSDNSKYFEKTLSDLKIVCLTKLAQNL